MLFPTRVLCTLIFLGGIFFARAELDLETLSEAEARQALQYSKSRSEDDRWNWIESLAQLAWGHVEADAHEKGALFYQKAVDELPDGAVDEEAGLVALLYDGLGRALQNSGKLKEARGYLQQAVTLRKGGDEKLKLGISQGHLGLLELTSGRYREAGRLFHDALLNTPKEQKGLLAHRFDCLGRYYLSLRDYGRAEDYFSKASEITGEDATEILLDLGANLALCHFRSGEVSKALEEVVALKVGVEDRARLATLLNLEATIRQAMGQVETGEECLQKAIQLLVEIRGDSHPALAPLLANLGALRYEDGRLDEAVESLLKAKALLKGRIEGHHQTYVEILYHLAACRPEMERIVAARRAGGALLDKLVASGGERELLAFRSQIDLHSQACQLGSAELIAESIFQAKGRVMEAVLERKQETRQVAEMRLELDRLLLKGEESSSERVGQLREAIDRLELVEKSPMVSPPSWRELAGALPAGVTYVDIVRYRDEEKRFQYGAVIFDSNANVRWVRLGAEKLTNRLDLLQRSLRDRADSLRRGEESKGMPMVPLLGSLYRSFWKPIQDALPEGTRKVILCPEGRLHLLPYAVLYDQKEGEFLCGKLEELTLVDAGRRLLRGGKPEVSLTKPWAGYGVSNFAAQRRLIDREDSPWSNSLSNLSDLESVEEELKQLGEIAPSGSRFLLNERAHQEILQRRQEAPAVLHLASHGFYHRLSIGDGVAPYYESGIVMGSGGKMEDVLLFSEEVAALNLSGTQLVTLSTCRSASGQPVSGEGIMGLGRGFFKAGARSVFASLWEIPDESTARFMANYYGRLIKEKDSPSALLWKMQGEGFAKYGNGDHKGEAVEVAILSIGGFTVTGSSSLGINKHDR